MVGGDAAAFAEVKPILEAMGNPERIIRIGESGAGQMCKVCNQMVIGGTLAGGQRGVRAGAQGGRGSGEGARGAARRVRGEPRARGPRRADPERQLQAGIPRAALREGLSHRGETLAAHQVPAPVSAEVHQLVTTLLAAGKGEMDYSALATVISLAGLDRAAP